MRKRNDALLGVPGAVAEATASLFISHQTAL